MKIIVYGILLIILAVLFSSVFFQGKIDENKEAMVQDMEDNNEEIRRNIKEETQINREKNSNRPYLKYELDEKINPYYKYQEPIYLVESDCENVEPVIYSGKNNTSKQFRDNFFNFRDFTFYDTSQKIDPVDNINHYRKDMYGMAIKDIYDEIIEN